MVYYKYILTNWLYWFMVVKLTTVGFQYLNHYTASKRILAVQWLRYWKPIVVNLTTMNQYSQ